MGKGDPQGGRPLFELSDSDFEKLVSMIRIQCTREEVCGIFGVTEKTINEALRRRGEPGFSLLLKRHQDEGKASLRRSQWKVAQDGNPTMLIWLGKQMLGQRDVSRNEVSGPDGDPIQHEHSGAAVSALKGLVDSIAVKNRTPGDPAGE